MNDLDYIFAVARIHVREKGLLSDADIRAMTQMKTAGEIVQYLVGKGWASAPDADQMLVEEENKTMELMEELRLDPELLEILSYPRLFHNLKTGIQEVVTTESHGHAFYDLKEFDRSACLRILREKAFDELPKVLQGVAPAAYESMLKTHDGQVLDTMVDKACLEAMLKAGEQSKNRLFRRYEELTVCLTDIKIALRALYMGKTQEYLKDALVANPLLDVSELAKSAVSKEELLSFLNRSGFTDAAEAIALGQSAFERWFDNKLIELIKPEKYHYESLGPILAFYLARENEIKTVRIILTAKANGFSDQVIEERVRQMYV